MSGLNANGNNDIQNAVRAWMKIEDYNNVANQIKKLTTAHNDVRVIVVRDKRNGSILYHFSMPRINPLVHSQYDEQKISELSSFIIANINNMGLCVNDVVIELVELNSVYKPHK